jgi:hypothetical protein
MFAMQVLYPHVISLGLRGSGALHCADAVVTRSGVVSGHRTVVVVVIFSKKRNLICRLGAMVGWL